MIVGCGDLTILLLGLGFHCFLFRKRKTASQPWQAIAQRFCSNAAIAKADKIDRSKYTEESLKALDDAVAAVEKGLKESEQDKVDAMAAAIEKALDGLKKKPAADDDKKNDSKKDDSNKDDSNKNDLNKNDSDKKADAVKTTTVKTGDAANVIPFFGMTLLAAGAVIVIAFKKKRRA